MVLNLEALKKKYSVFLPYLAHRSDLEYLIRNMLGEIGIRARFVGAAIFLNTKVLALVCLAADYEIVNGYYN
jgi:tricorn protease